MRRVGRGMACAVVLAAREGRVIRAFAGRLKKRSKERSTAKI